MSTKTANRLMKFYKGLKSQGREVAKYYKDIAANPTEGAKKLWRTGSSELDPSMRTEVLSDALDTMIAKGAPGELANKVRYTGLDNTGGITNWLRRRGILAAGREATGTLSPQQQQQLVDQLKQRGLLFTKKDGTHVVHKDAYKKVKELEEVYRNAQNMKSVGGISTGSKLRNLSNYVPLPGERGLTMIPAGIGAGSELLSDTTEDGRKKSIGERIGRAGAVMGTDVALSPLGVAGRRFGIAAPMAIGFGGSMATQGALSAMDKKLAKPQPVGQPIKPNTTNTGFPQPQFTPPPPPKLASVPTNPRQILRGLVK